MAWVSAWALPVALGLLLTFLPLLFPDGRPPSPRWRPVGWLGAGAIALSVVPTAAILWPVRGPVLLLHPERAADSRLLEAAQWGMPLLLLSALAATVSLIVRFRNARGDQRQQLKWFTLAGALTLVGAVGREAISLIAPDDGLVGRSQTLWA